ncbi:MAG: uroporphyrinogen decarboxylase [Acidobacteria bacterium]|nr:uroporphyrinogen decarboxylase [Acidobacteriota bacterium]
MTAPESRFIKACRAAPVDATPVWFMRQAGRYMPEYRTIRKKHSLLEICKQPKIAAEVTITAAEELGVDAAIIFADLLLPLEIMGLAIHFSAGEGPKIDSPIESAADVRKLRSDRAAELGYVSEAVRLVCAHFGSRLPVIGFCGAPFTLASYMIEGGGSRNYIRSKRIMFNSPQVWEELMQKLITVTSAYAAEQVRAGAAAIQFFDSWVGCLSVEDYRQYVLPGTTQLIHRLRETGVPVIYFATDSATLLPAMKETGADVIGVDWRIPLDVAWRSIDFQGAVQGNLDPAVLLADWRHIERRAGDILDRARLHDGHIFNLGHGILPETPVDNVRALAAFVHEYSARLADHVPIRGAAR